MCMGEKDERSQNESIYLKMLTIYVISECWHWRRFQFSSSCLPAFPTGKCLIFMRLFLNCFKN